MIIYMENLNLMKELYIKSILELLFEKDII